MSGIGKLIESVQKIDFSRNNYNSNSSVEVYCLKFKTE